MYLTNRIRRSEITNKLMGVVAKISTWVQVAMITIVGIVQIALTQYRPEMVWFGSFTIIVLAALTSIIIWTDHKRRMAEIELTARKNGALDALQDIEKSFRKNAEDAKTKQEREFYIKAANCIHENRCLLRTMLKKAKT